jgi:hypothetical protein
MPSPIVIEFDTRSQSVKVFFLFALISYLTPIVPLLLLSYSRA